MSDAMKMPRGVAISRADICAACPAPCEWQTSADAHADPRNACALGRWPRWGRGDALASVIEERVLGPFERAFPGAAGIVEAARNCGGCKADVARLNGDGSRGSNI